jgi:hypothetical protein
MPKSTSVSVGSFGSAAFLVGVRAGLGFASAGGLIALLVARRLSASALSRSLATGPLAMGSLATGLLAAGLLVLELLALGLLVLGFLAFESRLLKPVLTSSASARSRAWSDRS